MIDWADEFDIDHPPKSKNLKQNQWLPGYLLKGTENSHESFGVNEEIRIVILEDEMPNQKSKRF
mgnify:CR=1 FL=1